MAELLRFYNDFQPSHYDLYIDINRSKKTIVGKTTIVGEAKKTDIAIHQKYLNVKSVKENGKNAEFKVDDANDAILKMQGKQSFSSNMMLNLPTR